VAIQSSPTRAATVAACRRGPHFLRTYGVRQFNVYRAIDLQSRRMAASKPALNAGGSVLFAKTGGRRGAHAAGCTDLHLRHRHLRAETSSLASCNEAHAMHLACSPSVGPGTNARRGETATRCEAARHGATYESSWSAGARSEGPMSNDHVVNDGRCTQIERRHTEAARSLRYLSYDGAWGSTAAAGKPPLTRTRTGPT